jgi:hypothetical protein
MKIISVVLFQAAFASAALATELPRAPAIPDAPRSAERAAQPFASIDEFDRLDVNHDSVLSRAELAHHPKAAHMAMVDENGDGVLGRGEFAELEGM